MKKENFTRIMSIQKTWISKDRGNTLSRLLSVAFIMLFSLTQSQAQYCTMVCNSQVNLSLNGDCESTITYDMIMEDGNNPAVCLPNGPQAFDIIVNYPPGTNTYNPPNIVDESHVGHNLTIMVEHTSTGNICWGYLLVEDKFAPVVTCPSDVTISCADPLPSGTLPSSTITECSGYTQSFSDQYVNIDCATSSFTAQIIRTYEVTDAYFNTRTCTQTISIERATLADVEPPIHYDGSGYPNHSVLNCGDSTDPSVIPGPTINGQPIVNGGSCDIVASHADQIIDLCGGSYKIIRTYTIADWCANVVETMHQIIMVSDQLPPSISCQNDFDAGTNSSTCGGTISLPPATVSDACSEPVTVVIQTSSGVINSNGGVLSNAALGTHVVTYIATDQCGNSSSCTMNVTVGDSSGPIAICNEHTVVSLGDNPQGVTQVCAQVFDDGSFDNCGIVSYQVRRMDAPSNAGFSDCVEFSCADLGGPVMVQFQVHDAAGNYNECMVEVVLQDKVDPTLICPPDKTLECNADFLDLNVTGIAIGNDNCSATVTHVDVTSNVDNCGEGLIIRRWTVDDGNGNTAVCDQRIYLENSGPFTSNNIAWPADPNNYACTTVDALDPEDLPTQYSEPSFSGDNCDMIVVTYDDQVFDMAPPACFKILRHWIVIDWCQYDPNLNPDQGRWEHVQVIEVMDNEAPVLSGPDDITVVSTAPGCGVGAVTIAPATATDCNPSVTISHNSSYASNGANASGSYPYGTTLVTFTAMDGCGNSSTTEVSITVVDGKLPSPVAINGLATTLMDLTPEDLTDANAMMELWATDFEAGSSFDNCTAYGDLIFRIRKAPTDGSVSTSPPSSSNVTFDCGDLGFTDVELWVMDEAGNWDFVITTIDVQDNSFACGGGTQPEEMADIMGYLETEEHEMIENADVGIAGYDMPGITTAADGSFGFTDLPENQNYTVTPEKDMNPLNGVTTYDLILMQKHILNILPLDSPYKIIAADINRSETVTTLDGVQLRRLILNITTDFPNNTSWRFVDKDFQFPNPVNPFQTYFPEVYSVNGLTGDEMEADFIGVKIGDLNGSVIPNSFMEAEDRGPSAELKLMADDQQFNAGEEVRLAIKANAFKDILGYQYTLNFDHSILEFKDINIAELASLKDDHFGLTDVQHGIITTSWNQTEPMTLQNDAVLFEIVFTANESARLSDLIQINSRVTSAEAYAGVDLSLLSVGLTFNAGTGHQLSAPFELYQNQPNPFSESTNISFMIAQPGKVVLQISDVSGKIIYAQVNNLDKGFHQVTLDKAIFKTNGIYYYHLETADQTATKKMMLIK